MKTIGLIGGLSWGSSAENYIKHTIRQETEGSRDIRIIEITFDFREIKALQQAGKWNELTRRMTEAAQILENAGAEFILICSNTMHKIADEVERQIEGRIYHIADSVGHAVAAKKFQKVGLLGSVFTMEDDFYRGRLNKLHLNVLTPEKSERNALNAVIYDELAKGKATDAAHHQFRLAMNELVRRGAEAIILGSTEIMMLVQRDDSAVPLFDSMTHHAAVAARMVRPFVRPSPPTSRQP